MESLIESSRKKEIHTQVELYRLFQNVCVHPSQRQPMFGGSITSRWEPHDVLVEPTILAGEKNKEADLVLLGRSRNPPLEIQPLLIVEVKRRKVTHLTQSYRAYLKQSYGYAHALGCPCYAVYDGNTWIIMQMADPYLIGFFQRKIGVDHKTDIGFAEKIWNAAGHVKEQYRSEPIGEFSKHSDFIPWERSIKYFLKDAFRRSAFASGWEPTEEWIEEKASVLEKRWIALSRDYLV